MDPQKVVSQLVALFKPAPVQAAEARLSNNGFFAANILSASLNQPETPIFKK